MSNGVGRNAVLSAVSWLVPAVVAVVAVPITVRGLGDDGYGIVTLVGAVTGYLGLMELGLGRGVVRYLAMFVSLGHGRALRGGLRAVLAWFAGAGVLGAGAMVLLAPWLVHTVLRVPVALQPDAVVAFRIGGLSFAAGLLVSILSAVPEAFLRYDLVAWLGGGFASLSFAGPAVLVSLGYGVIPVMWLAVGVNTAACIAWGSVAVALSRRVPEGGPGFREYAREFVGFSAATAVNRIWSGIQEQTSRLVVGIAGGTAQAAYFQIPNVLTGYANGLLNRLNMVLLPTGTKLSVSGDQDAVIDLYERSSRVFYVLNASVACVLVVFGAPLLAEWVGPQYGRIGGPALAVLALAAAINATSMAASQLNMALGRPKVNLAFSVLNSIVQLSLVYWLTVTYGITGTAMSGLIAAGMVLPFLHYTHRRVLHTSSWKVLRECYLGTSAAVIAVGVAAWFALRPLAAGLVPTLLLMLATGAVAVVAASVSGGLDSRDRAALRRLFARDRSGVSPDGAAGMPGGDHE